MSPWSAALTLERKHRTPEAPSPPPDPWGVWKLGPAQKNKRKPGREASELPKALARDAAQPRHQCVITKALTLPESRWRLPISHLTFLKRGWRADLPGFKVHVALPGSEDNVKAKNHGDPARVRVPRPWCEHALARMHTHTHRLSSCAPLSSLHTGS